MIECCANCKHYKEAYCSLMDDLVELEDKCPDFEEEIEYEGM